MPHATDRDRSAPAPSLERSVADAIRIADRYVTHLMNKPPSDPAVESKLNRICELLCELKQQGQAMFQELDAKVEKITNVSNAIEAMLDGVKKKLDEAIAAGGNVAELKAKIAAVSASLDKEAEDMAAAVVRNTPVENQPETPPVP